MYGVRVDAAFDCVDDSGPSRGRRSTCGETVDPLQESVGIDPLALGP